MFQKHQLQLLSCLQTQQSIQINMPLQFLLEGRLQLQYTEQQIILGQTDPQHGQEISTQLALLLQLHIP